MAKGYGASRDSVNLTLIGATECATARTLESVLSLFRDVPLARWLVADPDAPQATHRFVPVHQ